MLGRLPFNTSVLFISKSTISPLNGEVCVGWGGVGRERGVERIVTFMSCTVLPPSGHFIL